MLDTPRPSPRASERIAPSPHCREGVASRRAPAVPLTASAGYLFGVAPGTAVVLLAAAVAASVSFLIGRTIGRDWILQVASGNDRFRALDSVISQEGFKIVLLLRLSPLFPFALSNYLYGLTSVPFWDYFWGTLLGCARRARACQPGPVCGPCRGLRGGVGPDMDQVVRTKEAAF